MKNGGSLSRSVQKFLLTSLSQNKTKIIVFGKLSKNLTQNKHLTCAGPLCMNEEDSHRPLCVCSDASRDRRLDNRSWFSVPVSCNRNRSTDVEDTDKWCMRSDHTREQLEWRKTKLERKETMKRCHPRMTAFSVSWSLAVAFKNCFNKGK